MRRTVQICLLKYSGSGSKCRSRVCWMSSEQSVVMMGLPGSGKTTFLAALWHQLESAEIATAFTTDRLQRDREYLNRIRDAWIAFEEVPHTSAGIEQSALLHL